MSVGINIQCASIVCALLCQIIFICLDFWIYLISSLLFGALYFLIRKITKNKFGTGDVLFGFFQGLFLLPQLLPVCLGTETIIALCYIFIINKSNKKAPLPFIPFMATGLILSYIIQLMFFI